MTRSAPQAKQPAPDTRPPDAAGWRFPVFVMLGYLAACLPLLAARHFDPSVFVVAGDRFVIANQTQPRLRVKPGSDGYDGQFYYRLAVRPLAFAPRVDGIAFDNPAKRMARIGLPLLAWAATLGRPALAAWALFGVNLGGLGAIAWLARRLAAQLGVPSFVPLSIVLWPGFIVALLHDTTEIAGAAFLLAGLSAWFARQPALFALLACCAVLTRETSLAAWLGLLVAVGAAPLRRRDDAAGRATLRWLLACAAPVAIFVAWRSWLTLAWEHAAGPAPLTHDLGWPFLGALAMLRDCLTGARHWASTPAKDTVVRLYVLTSALPLLAVCALTAARLHRALAARRTAPLAAAWICLAAVMSLLTAGGPWIDPVAYLRAFTETFVVGCLVLGASGLVLRTRWVLGLGVAEAAMAWAFCMAQLR